MATDYECAVPGCISMVPLTGLYCAQHDPLLNLKGPAPVALAVPELAVQDLDDFITNLATRGVRRFHYEGNLKGAPIKLDVMFDNRRDQDE